jgi:hypothetical protein
MFRDAFLAWIWLDWNIDLVSGCEFGGDEQGRPTNLMGSSLRTERAVDYLSTWHFSASAPIFSLRVRLRIYI